MGARPPDRRPTGAAPRHARPPTGGQAPADADVAVVVHDAAEDIPSASHGRHGNPIVAPVSCTACHPVPARCSADAARRRLLPAGESSNFRVNMPPMPPFDHPQGTACRASPSICKACAGASRTGIVAGSRLRRSCGALVGGRPGAGEKGANRTGRPFTGDVAGELLYPALHRSRICQQCRTPRRAGPTRLWTSRIAASPMPCAACPGQQADDAGNPPVQ